MNDYPRHIESYYAGRAPQRSVRPALEGKVQAEVCVVGGGLAGLTTARELARRGKTVVLLEARRIGWGASGRNGGFVSAGYAEGLDAIEKRVGLENAKELYRHSRRGVDYVRGLIDSENQGHIVGGHGWLKLIRHDDADTLRRRRDKMADRYGVELEFWDKARVRETLATKTYFYGIHDPSPFHIDPLAYAEILAAKAESEGLVIFEATPATSVERSGSGWVVRSLNGAIEAQTVVAATSAHRVNGMVFPAVERAVLPVATYVITSGHLGDGLRQAIGFSGCIGDTRRAGDYYRIVEGDRLLWGGRITTRRSEPKHLAESLKADIRRIYPQLGDFKVDFAWSGLMGYARHKMPIVGEIAPGLWAATALGGHGLNTTATVGLLVAEALGDGDDQWRLFQSYKADWGGGAIGRAATQLEYFRLRALDAFEEWRAQRRQKS